MVRRGIRCRALERGLGVFTLLWLLHGGAAPVLAQTPAPTFASTPIPTRTPVPCFGDCDSDGAVTIDELIILVNIALGNAFVDACPAAAEDSCSDLLIFVTCVINAVNTALYGCAITPAPA